ncbi:MAG: hypothetical protein ABJL55_16250 [Roseibium sp.]
MVAENLLSILHNRAMAFKIFHIVFSAVILVASLKTAVRAVEVSNWALFTLATAEAIAVVLFVFPKFTKISGLVLMAIFLLAIVLSLVSGVIMSQLHLIVYFVCTYIIVVLDSQELTGEE